jgi:YggT family protein
MGFFVDVAVFLINLVVGIYLYTLIARVWMQKCRVNYWNPLSQFVLKVTNPLVKPCRRFIPGYAGIDFSVIFLVFVIQSLVIAFYLLIADHGFPAWLPCVSFLVGQVFNTTLNFFTCIVILGAVMSWFIVRGNNPGYQLISSLTRPLIKKAQRFVPLVGGFDLSPLIILVFLQVIRMLMVWPLFAFSVHHGIPQGLEAVV